MTSLRGRTAVVTGGSSGVGRATVRALLAEGATVTAVARGEDRLRALERELGAGLTVHQGGASDPAVAERLLREASPDVVVLAAGITPQMGRLDELAWESFSETWNTDLKATFHFLQEALRLPLRPGSTVVVVSSGAAVKGSPLSGGYAGAKRMQWLLAGYAQKLSDAKQLGVRVLTIVPDQLIAGTAIGAGAAAAYGAMSGITAEAFMQRFAVPLDPDMVAAAILNAIRGDVPAGGTAIAVRGTGVEALA